mmetsp:Transcript_93516/g.286180  ORF Transcript_93516/g.286180 Transcript_93516/m.286180 type:complete len:203 (+) Transcript_93516:1708-2316(+)
MRADRVALPELCSRRHPQPLPRPRPGREVGHIPARQPAGRGPGRSGRRAHELRRGCFERKGVKSRAAGGLSQRPRGEEGQLRPLRRLGVPRVRQEVLGGPDRRAEGQAPVRQVQLQHLRVVLRPSASVEGRRRRGRGDGLGRARAPAAAGGLGARAHPADAGRPSQVALRRQGGSRAPRRPRPHRDQAAGGPPDLRGGLGGV